jgi:hypothetical protein
MSQGIAGCVIYYFLKTNKFIRLNYLKYQIKGYDPVRNRSCQGCGVVQEHFFGCADVSILGDDKPTTTNYATEVTTKTTLSAITENITESDLILINQTDTTASENTTEVTESTTTPNLTTDLIFANNDTTAIDQPDLEELDIQTTMPFEYQAINETDWSEIDQELSPTTELNLNETFMTNETIDTEILSENYTTIESFNSENEFSSTTTSSTSTSTQTTTITTVVTSTVTSTTKESDIYDIETIAVLESETSINFSQSVSTATTSQTSVTQNQDYFNTCKPRLEFGSSMSISKIVSIYCYRMCKIKCEKLVNEYQSNTRFMLEKEKDYNVCFVTCPILCNC